MGSSFDRSRPSSRSERIISASEHQVITTEERQGREERNKKKQSRHRQTRHRIFPIHEIFADFIVIILGARSLLPLQFN